MGIVLVGAITKDTLIFIKRNKCEVTKSFGGILYTAIALSLLTKEKIYPVCNVGYDIYEDVIAILQKFENIKLRGIQKVNTKNIHCYILFASEYGTQYDKNKEIPISFEQIVPLIEKIKFIFVSPMTGYDIELATFKKIKQTTKSQIYFDYHILSLGRDKLGNRFLQKRKDWFEWCTNCDHLQLNKFESELLYEETISSKEDILNFSRSIMAKGVKTIAITLGFKGVVICYRDKSNSIKIKHFKAIKVDKVVDSTGCGDVFAAGFISHFINSKMILESYDFANKVAGLKVQTSGIQGLSELIKKMGMQWHND